MTQRVLRQMANKTAKVLVGAAVLYGVLCLLVKYLHHFLLFQPQPLAADFRYSFGEAFQELYFKPEKSARLNALWFKHKEPKIARRGCVLFLHGNRDNLVRWGNEYPERFISKGYDVLMYDYRGYGKSTGQRTEAALHADAQQVYNFLKTQISEDSIVVYGYSLGTGMAARLATNNRPKLLILEAPYASIPALGRSQLPIFPYEWLLDYQFRTDSCLARVRCPVYIFHGTADRIVPYENSQILAQIQNLNKTKPTLTTIPEGQHCCLDTSAMYRRVLDGLLFRIK